jgi:hypothetical protein
MQVMIYRLENLKFFNEQIVDLMEVSIGHALISESLYLGLENVVNMYTDSHDSTQHRFRRRKTFCDPAWLLGMADNWKTLGTQWSESGFQTISRPAQSRS